MRIDDISGLLCIVEGSRSATLDRMECASIDS
jgi:hypothetical protein